MGKERLRPLDEIIEAGDPNPGIRPEDGLEGEHSDPGTVVIVGATGDLTARKLLPALDKGSSLPLTLSQLFFHLIDTHLGSLKFGQMEPAILFMQNLFRRSISSLHFHHWHRTYGRYRFLWRSPGSLKKSLLGKYSLRRTCGHRPIAAAARHKVYPPW